MFRRLNIVRFWFTLSHFAVPAVALLSASLLRFQTRYFTRDAELDYRGYFGLVLISTLAWAIFSEHYDLTAVPIRPGELRRTAKAALWTMAAVLVLAFFYRVTTFSRVFTVVGSMLMFVVAVMLRQLFLRVVAWANVMPGGRLRIIVVGADHHASRVTQQLLLHSPMACDILGFVPLPGQDDVAPGETFAWDELERVVEEHQCHELLLALPPGRFDELPELINSLQNICVPIRLVMPFGEGILVKDRIRDCAGLPAVDLQPYAVDTIQYQLTKRVFDVAFSMVALMLVGPLMLLIALLIKLTSPGPVFFKQERVGMNGQTFTMLKFRSMRLDKHGASGVQQVLSKGDPRVTLIGAFLRRTSLDEVPQFINVLQGNMSVVGPRPEVPYYVQKFRSEIPAYMARHNVKCGITGWAQINGLRGTHTSIPKRIEYDLHYLRNWSLGLDVKIVL